MLGNNKITWHLLAFRLTKHPWKSFPKQAGPAATAVPSHRNSWWRWSWSHLAEARRSCSFPTIGWPSATGDPGSSRLRCNWWHLAQASTLASHEEASRLVAILETSCTLQWSHWTAWSPVAALLLASQQANCMPFAMKLTSYMPKVPARNRCVSPAMAGRAACHSDHGGCLSQTSHIIFLVARSSSLEDVLPILKWMKLDQIGWNSNMIFDDVPWFFAWFSMIFHWIIWLTDLFILARVVACRGFRCLSWTAPQLRGTMTPCGPSFHHFNVSCTQWFLRYIGHSSTLSLCIYIYIYYILLCYIKCYHIISYYSVLY